MRDKLIEILLKESKQCKFWIQFSIDKYLKFLTIRLALPVIFNWQYFFKFVNARHSKFITLLNILINWTT